jgi:long-subunit acyl-CoA synthetase (AMP-forming)
MSYYSKNRDKRLEYGKIYNNKNKEVMREYNHNYYMKFTRPKLIKIRKENKKISRKRRTLFYSEKIKRNKILDNENDKFKNLCNDEFKDNDKFKNLCNDEFKDNDDVLEIKKLLTIYFD